VRAVVGPTNSVKRQEIDGGCDRRAAIHAVWCDRRYRWYRGGAGRSGAGLADGRPPAQNSVIWAVMRYYGLPPAALETGVA
jgi:hypothetical protein